MDKATLLQQVAAMLEDDSLTEAITDKFENERGGLGFLLNTLKRRPRTFSPYVFKGLSILGQPATLDVKTAELVAVGAAAALMCEHCLEAHINRAVAEGATFEEVLDAILVAGAIAESSTLAVALRKFKQLELKHNNHTSKENA
ncbi:MAG TPA: carboxymuconolactone decarboxylase family protein [Anaerolineae bacterium]|nr:carboxymuconolactone decarboxylase family protein [Anaerolineae bacterium]